MRFAKTSFHAAMTGVPCKKKDMPFKWENCDDDDTISELNDFTEYLEGSPTAVLLLRSPSEIGAIWACSGGFLTGYYDNEAGQLVPDGDDPIPARDAVMCVASNIYC